MRQGWSIVAVVGLVSLVLAGCLDETGESASARARRLGQGTSAGTVAFHPEWFELALPNGDEHNHKDLAQHTNLSTPNFDVVGWDPLVTEYHGKAAGGYFCGDVSAKTDDRQLAVVHSWVSDVGFILLDISDPANPRMLSEFLLQNSHVYDLAITEDQQYVLLGTIHDGQNYDAGYGPVTIPPLASQLVMRDACTGEERVVDGPEQGLPFASGLILVDITNPRNPTIADFRHFPILGSHSVVSADVGGRTIVVSTVENIPGELSYYVFLEILQTPAGAKLQLLSI
ncbi:MAG TPA: hypothetical protein VGB18_02960, partial [Candidatus Thermoplasmatota archaeon]